MRNQFDIIVVGGGIVGCSIAYHLSLSGEQSVCLLERHKLTSGTTWHAAGLVAQLRASTQLTRLARYSGELYEALQNSGESTGFRRTGALTLAKHAERRFELEKLAAMARRNGVDCAWLASEEITERWPHIAGDDLLGGVYLPADGQTNPVDTTLALARRAKAQGVELYEDTPVQHLLAHNGVIYGVATQTGEIHANQVVLCAGLWSRDLGAGAGANFPLYPAEHFYAVTEPLMIPGDQPILRVPDDGIYIKPDAGRLLIGCFESQAKPIAPAALGENFNFAELPFDLEHFSPYLQAALKRIPEATDIGIRTWFNGPESFTPDGRYLLGESPEVSGLYIAAGFNSIGIQSAGGVGRVMAQWMQNQHPPMDLWEVDVRRFMPLHNQDDFLRQRTAETLGRLYAMHWPFFQSTSARNQRLSPVHDELAGQGACFGELAGWERANWYATPGAKPTYQYSYGKQNWFENCRLEHQAVRTDVALFDQTSFAKYLVRGVDACRFLNHLSTADLDVAIGQVVYCQWLNANGGIEADVTITRLHEGIYWVVSAAASVTRDLHWMRRHQRGFRVQVDDISQRYAVFGIMGPNARTHLQRFTDTPLEDETFPFATSRQIVIAGVQVRAMRITYVGELGWEIYAPWEEAATVYRALSEPAIKHAGYHAMDSLRMEKAYRHWGHDITDEDSPLQAGLGFTINWDKSFIGKDALQAAKAQPLQKRLTLFQLADPDVLLTHDEPIWAEGEPQPVGHIRSSAYSYHLNCSLALGYVEHPMAARRQDLLAGSFSLEVGPRKIPALAHLRAVYDPQNLRIRG